MLSANLTQNGLLAPAGGFPFALYVGQETVQAVTPKSAVTVVATVVPEYIADVHIALYTAPANSGDPDGAPVLQVDSLGVTSRGATLTITIPTTLAPAVYVARLWFDNALSGKPDTVTRDAAVTDTTKQPLVPFGVTVTNFQVT